MYGVHIAPQFGVIIRVIEADVIQVVTTETDAQAATEQFAQVSAADSLRAKLKMDYVGRQRDDGRIKVKASSHTAAETPQTLAPIANRGSWRAHESDD